MWLWDLLISVTSTREDNIMTEWKEYTGSDEQIAEMRHSIHGFVARNEDADSSIIKVRFNQVFIEGQKDPILPELFPTTLKSWLDAAGTTHYLICNPHPLADMICRQARTGQPVWVRIITVGYGAVVMVTTTPDWALDAEYSFTEFREEV